MIVGDRFVLQRAGVVIYDQGDLEQETIIFASIEYCQNKIDRGNMNKCAIKALSPMA